MIALALSQILEVDRLCGRFADDTSRIVAAVAEAEHLSTLHLAEARAETMLLCGIRWEEHD
jgi:hypothetical protein